MTDIKERLRLYGEKRSVLPHAEIMLEAADEIERLEGLLKAKVTPGYELLADQIEKRDAEIERLRAMLRDRPRDDGTVVAVGGEPGASAGKSE